MALLTEEQWTVTSVVGNIESMFPFHFQSNLRKQDRRPFKFWFFFQTQAHLIWEEIYAIVFKREYTIRMMETFRRCASR